MNVLVTGAAGFFGRGIVARLREAGHHVLGASRHIGDSEGTFTLDITSPESCARVFAAAGPVDAVVHAAALAHVRPGAIAPGLCHEVNATGTSNVLEAAIAAGVPRFVYISSVMVYGDADLPPIVSETDACHATGVYGEAKRLAETICEARQGAIDVTTLRMTSMYSDDWLTNIRKRVRPINRGRPFYFTLDPDARRFSLCSRRNGAEAVLWAVEGRLPPQVFNVADDYVYSQREILDAVEKVDGPGPRLPVPMAIPRAMWRVVQLGVPSATWRANARSRYWKFCERNVYSPDKLNACGLATPPDLLALAGRS
jgi:nucleoside-diphosphate-sugar epimerase